MLIPIAPNPAKSNNQVAGSGIWDIVIVANCPEPKITDSYVPKVRNIPGLKKYAVLLPEPAVIFSAAKFTTSLAPTSLCELAINAGPLHTVPDTGNNTVQLVRFCKRILLNPRFMKSGLINSNDP